MIPYGRQDVTAADIDAVIHVLRSDFLTQGPVVPRFESSVARAVSAAHAVAMNSATAALHLACRALELGPGDWLWTSPITFVASANCARYCGAKVDFVDIDERSFNICPQALEEKLQRARRDGRLPKVVVPVHMTGQSSDMEAIGRLAKEYGFRVLEDASHAIGASHQGEPVGKCVHSDIAVFSFHPVKIVTTGEGGVACTQDAALAERMELLRSHGITRNPARMSRAPEGPWYYEQIDLGFNYRMTELQAALGLSQMARIKDYVARRHALAERYDRSLQGLPLRTPWRDANTYSAFHLYVVTLENPARRAQVFETLRCDGVGANVHYIPVHLHPYYRALGFAPGDFPRAESYYQRALSLPLFPTLAEADQDRVVASLGRALPI